MAESRTQRSMLLDARFQLKWTGYLVGVVLVVMAGLGVLIGKTSARASDAAAIAVKQAEKAFQESLANSISTRRTVQMAAGDSPAFAAVMEEELGKHDAELGKELEGVRARQEEIAHDRTFVRNLIIGAGGVLLALLVFMGILITHRIVGPVHKMKRLLRKLSTGRLVVDERLRRGDELEDLFETFLQATYSLRAMQRARLATLDETITRAESTGSATEVIDGLRVLRAQLVLGLEPRRHSTIPPENV
jgi:nitrogen fixation/metabolism regulation signal transduction histidine kinase